MGVIGPSVEVDAPLYEPGVGGLLESVPVLGAPTRVEAGEVPEDATDADETSERWENGIHWRPNGACGNAGRWAVCSGEDLDVTGDDADVNVEAIPFFVYSAYRCSSFAFESGQYLMHAETNLNRFLGQQIEEELWSGSLAAAQVPAWPNPALASADTAQVNSGTATPLAYGLADLQEAMRDCLGGFRGVIHATTKAVTLWESAGLVHHKRYVDADGREYVYLCDTYGNTIVAGSGYDGSDPDGNIDGTGDTAWAYATGPLIVRVGPLQTIGDPADTLERTANNVTVYAGRAAVAAFDGCCVFGVNVDLCSPCCTPSEDGS